MNDHLSMANGQEKLPPNWSALPPLPLWGVATPLVESLEHYTRRLLQATGVSFRQVVADLKQRSLWKNGTPASFRTALGLSPGSAYRMEVLERLTGRSELRYGTFWAMSEVLSLNTSLYGERRRRWCPVCYELWTESSYEPLIWSIDLLGCCPIHACRLECKCSRCGAYQPEIHSLNPRRICASCKCSLARGANFARQPDLLEWVDRQVGMLIEYCATPRSDPMPWMWYAEFVAGLRDSARRHGPLRTSLRINLRNVDRHARRRSRQPTIRSLLNLCALQGIDIDAFLAAPTEASGPRLFDQWAGLNYLPLPSAVQAQSLFVAVSFLRDFVEAKPDYYPSLGLLLRAFHVQSLAVRDLCPELFDGCRKAHYAPGPRKVYALRKACLYALFILDRADRARSSPDEVVDDVANTSEIDLADAASVVDSCLIVRGLQSDEKICAYRSRMPIRQALEWFVRTRDTLAYRR